LDILFISFPEKIGLVVLQQFAHFKQSVQANTSS